jgi:hypothetical protein
MAALMAASLDLTDLKEDESEGVDQPGGHTAAKSDPALSITV